MPAFFKNLNEILSFIYIPTKIFGMAPFERHYDKNRQRYYFKVRPFGLQHLLLNGGLMLYIALALFLRALNEFLERPLDLIFYTTGLSYILFHLFAIAIIFIFVVKQNHFVKCLEIIEVMDELFEESHLPVNYNLVQIIGVVTFTIVYPLYIIVIGFPFWELIVVVRRDSYCSFRCRGILIQLLAFPFFTFARRYFVYLYSTILLIATQRLKTLNDYVEDFKPNDYQSVNDLQSFVMKGHNLLHHLVREIGEVFSLPVILYVSMVFIEILTVGVASKYSDNYNLYQGMTALAVSLAELLENLIICEAYKYQTERVARVETTITLPYFNKNLAKKRQGFLLQITHEKILLTAHGCYDLNMSVITLHVGVLGSLLMFLLQLRQQLL